MDVARWGLGKTGMPNSVMSVGGRFAYVDDGETANTQVCVFDYGDATLIFEVRGLMTDDVLADMRGKATPKKAMQAKVGNVFHGDIQSASSFRHRRNNDAVAVSNDDEILQVFKAKKEDDHFGKLRQCRARESTRNCCTPTSWKGTCRARCATSATSATGSAKRHRSTVRPFSNVRGRSGSNRPTRFGAWSAHLEKTGVKPSEAKCRSVGATLAIDAKTETFAGNKRKANALLTREYRKGFEVPTRF